MHINLETGEPVNFNELESLQTLFIETNEEGFRTELQQGTLS